MAECDENLVLGVMTMEVERAGEAKIDILDREAAVQRDAVRIVQTYGSDAQ